LLPERVVNLIWTEPPPFASAPCDAEVSVTSSMASSRGVTMAKKPSLVLSVVSWMFAPSSEMLIELCG